MAKHYDIKGNSGEIIIPLEDGIYYTDKMTTRYRRLIVSSFIAYDQDHQPVSSATGNAEVRVTPNQIQWHKIANSEFSLSDCIVGDVEFEMPSSDSGDFAGVKLTLSSTGGAAFFSCRLEVL